MRVGVTGNFASGKGTVCKMFASLGGHVVDTDIIARQIVEPGEPALDELAQHFGNDIINEKGFLNRHLLAERAFTSEENSAALNAIMHPRIFSATLEQTADPALIYFINAPLLFEAGFNSQMNKIIVVRALRSQMLERGAQRDGMTAEQISQRLNFQKELNETLHFADFVIDNTGLLESTQSQVQEIWKILLKIHNASII